MMLEQQLDTWRLYDDEALEKFSFIVVDDCSPTPLVEVVKKAEKRVLDRLRLFRMTKDVPWNRNICRNAAASVTETEWLIQTDVDHTLPPLCANALLKTDLDSSCWFRFPRCRVGKADETRRKDDLPDDEEFGPIREHMDSYLIRKELFMSSPYDSDYTGFLGGGTPFIERMKKIAPLKMTPNNVHLYVYTRHVIPDASVITLNRDTDEYKKRRKEKERSGNTEPKNILNFDWERLL